MIDKKLVKSSFVAIICFFRIVGRKCYKSMREKKVSEWEREREREGESEWKRESVCHY